MKREEKQDRMTGILPVPDRAFTHGGIFHADDVFAAALLRYLNPGIRIERGMQVPEGYDGLVFDMGGGAFDHHQVDKRYRKNGKPYAAFGLLWEAFGARILCEADVKKFDREFVQRMDESDNTGTPHEIGAVVHDFNSTWEEDMEDQDGIFFELVGMAVRILERRFCHMRAERAAYERVREQIEEQLGPVLFLERALPWKEAVSGTGILYVVYPSARGGYSIQAAPMGANTTELKKPFPEPWRGRTGEELAALTGIPGFGFCHPGGFLCAADTKEDARRVAEAALEAGR